MYYIEKTDGTEYEILPHGEDIFLRAHALGERRFTVLLPDGEGYDLVPVKNDDYKSTYFDRRFPGQTVFPDYTDYDETSEDTLYLKPLRLCRAVRIDFLCEYTAVLARLILRKTNNIIYCTDRRLIWFTGESERIRIVTDISEIPETGCMRIGDLDADRNGVGNGFGNIGPISAFHNVFFLQGVVHSLQGIKYGAIDLDPGAGIGSILVTMNRYKKAFSELGLEMVLVGESVGRFRSSFISEHFSFSHLMPDVSEENTLHLKNVATYAGTFWSFSQKGEPDLNVLSRKFIAELEEHSQAVIGGKKMLGVLIRGTDYALVNPTGPKKMATVSDMIPLIHEWMENFGFDGIFLATEDQDIYEKMTAEFGKTLSSVAQKRHRTSELVDKYLLSSIQTDEELEENTVKYLHALYILSRCDSFVCSGWCNGYDLVLGLRQGDFSHMCCFKEGKPQ